MITPSAKKAVKQIPIAASGLVLLLSEIKPINKLASIPEIIAPMKNGICKIKDTATPGSTA